MDIVLGYLAGLLTLINPCVLPILPIVLATSFQAGRAGPVALAAGMSLSFVTLGMLVSTLGYSLGIDEQITLGESDYGALFAIRRAPSGPELLRLQFVFKGPPANE